MRKIKEILRLHFEYHLSNRKIGHSLQISKTSVFNCLDRFKNSSLKWPLSEEMTEDDVEDRLYSPSVETSETLLPDFFYECVSCNKVIKPRKGDCCVFCSYGNAQCPPKPKIFN